MTALISDDAIRRYYSMGQCVEAVAKAFAAAGQGRFDVSERKVVAVDDGARLLSLTAASGELGRLIAHVYSGAPVGQDKNRSPVNQRKKLYLVFEAATGACEVIVGGEYLSWLKTGAMGAVAIDHLASPTARRLAILGSGRQARAALAGALVVRPFDDVFVWSRDPDNVRRMISEFPDVAGLEAAGSAREAVTGAEVVVTTTTSSDPVLHGEWLAEGCHVNSIGAHYPDHREVDAEAVGRSTVVVDSHVTARAEKGELIMAEREGAFGFEEVAGELGEIVAGTSGWTRAEGENTLFASCGSAIESLGAVVGAMEAVPAGERESFTF